MLPRRVPLATKRDLAAALRKPQFSSKQVWSLNFERRGAQGDPLLIAQLGLHLGAAGLRVYQRRYPALTQAQRSDGRGAGAARVKHSRDWSGRRSSSRG